MLLTFRPAVSAACGPTELSFSDTLQPGEIANVSPSAMMHVARNSGVLFSVDAAKDVDEAAVKARLVVTVTQSGAALPGALRRVKVIDAARSLYLWQPTAPLVPGDITMGYVLDAGPVEGTRAMIVDDRVAVARNPDVRVDVTNYDVDDPAAPVITCTPHPYGCSVQPATKSIALRSLARPRAVGSIGGTSDPDASFYDIEGELFGRDADGTTSGAEPGVKPSPYPSRFFDRTWGEYCMHTKTTLLGTMESTEQTVCEATVIDTSVKTATDNELRRRVKDECAANVVYPQGSTAEAPAGEKDSAAPSSTGSGGCSTGGSAPSGYVAVLAALALVTGRRARGRRDRLPPATR